MRNRLLVRDKIDKFANSPSAFPDSGCGGAVETNLILIKEPISIMKRISVLLLPLAGWLGCWGGVPQGYYDSLEGKSGTALKAAVKTVGKRGHRTISYGDKTWDAFKVTDVRVVNGKECWWDMYSSDNVAVSSGHGGLNIEHSVANSWWDGGKNDAYKDIVHLNPSNATANNRKSNYPLGEIATVTWENGITFVGNPVSGQGGGSKYVYEPHDMYKGDFARAFFYMFTVYDDITWKDDWNWMYDKSSALTLRPWAYQLLLKWAKEDPVSQKEIDRNEGIYKKQGNRNPFIDNPQLAEHIWGSKSNEGFVYDGSYDPGTNPPVDPIDPIDPTPGPSGTPGEWIWVKNLSEITAEGEYVIVSAGESSTRYGMSSTLDGKIISSAGEVTVKNGVISELPSSMGVLKLENAGAGKYYMHLYDMAGGDKGYLSSSTQKTMTLSSSKGAYATISISGGNAEISYGSAGKFQYNMSAPRFTTYTSKQTAVQLYKKVEAEEELEMPLFYAVDHNGEELEDGRFGKECHVEISHPDSEVSLYYTMDGTDPSVTFSNNLPSAGNGSTHEANDIVMLTATTTLKAVAAKNGKVSPVATQTYTYDTQVGVESVNDMSVFVEVWGNNILVPPSAVIYDLNGRVVNGTNLTPGVYIVNGIDFARPVKVIIGK